MIIFGSGTGAFRTITLLSRFSEKIAYFVDNNINKIGNSIFGKPIMNVEKLYSENKDETLILIGSEYINAISEQPQKMGFNKDEHFISVFDSLFVPNTNKNRIVNEVKVGRYTYGYLKHCKMGNFILKEIGSFCSINETASIGIGNHPIDLITGHPLIYLDSKELFGSEGIPGIVHRSEILTEQEREKY